MGNASCHGCCKDNKELETKELNYERTPTTSAEMSLETPAYQPKLSQQVVVQLQALWRAYLVRKSTSHLLRQSVPNHSYFTAKDCRETLSSTHGPGLDRVIKSALRYKSGGVYTGEWLGGFRDGFGEMVWRDGAKYSGNWSYGKPFGLGQFRHIDGEVYDGNWSHCRVKQRDVFFTNGNLRIGDPISDGYVWLIVKQEEFRVNPPKAPTANVFGRLLVESKLKTLLAKQQKLDEVLQEPRKLLARALVPSEMLEAGKREFKQKRYPNGNIYIGEWLDNKRDGNGKHIWSNGDVYSGGWKDDMQSGWGKSNWVDGSSYTGSYSQNIKEGTGEYHWKDNSMYVGEWKANEMDGHGEYHWTDGRKYIGDWSRSRMEGYGVFFWPDGRRFEGAWKKGQKHGEGVMHLADGTVTHETWHMGKVMSKAS
jgi:hypothetical protein